MPDRKHVAILAYRRWALQAAGDIVAEFTGSADEWQFNLIETQQQAERIAGPLPMAILAIGWSWKIEQPREGHHVPILIFHPSPLPHYRGGSPIQHQMLAGERTSALSIFETDENATWDSGPLYWQRAFSLDGTLTEVLERVRRLSAEGGLSALQAIADGSYATTPQPPTEMEPLRRREPWQSELTPEMLSEMTGLQIFNFIRSLQAPYPVAFLRGNDGVLVPLGTRPPETADMERYGIPGGSVMPTGVAGAKWKQSIEAAKARVSE